jgi:hypothetical protein
MRFKLAYETVLKAGYDVQLNDIEALINELRHIFYQLHCTNHFQVSVASLDRELLTVYQADVASQSNQQPSLLANLIFTPLAIALEEARLRHKSDQSLSALFQALQLQQVNHTELLVNRYIRYQLFSPYAEKVYAYTPIRQYLFFATRGLLNQFNPASPPSSNSLVESLGYTWEGISQIMEGSREGLALLKLYYEQSVFEKGLIKKIPKVLKKDFKKSKDDLVQYLWEQIQEGDLSQRSHETTFDQHRFSKVQSGKRVFILTLWLIVLSVLGGQVWHYVEHHIQLQKENDKLFIELEKNGQWLNRHFIHRF